MVTISTSVSVYERDLSRPSTADIKNDTCRIFRHVYSCRFYHIYIPVCEKPLLQVAGETELCTLVPNVCAPLVCNSPHFTPQTQSPPHSPAPRISKWRPTIFTQICAPLFIFTLSVTLTSEGLRIR